MQVVSQEFLTIRARPWRWPNTTRFLVLGSEIPLVISHGVNQNFGGKFLCQLHINSCYLTVREKAMRKFSVVKMQKNASITWKAHWIVLKFQQLTKLITKPLEYT